MPETEVADAETEVEHDPAETVFISHECTEGVGVCTREQYAVVYEPKGWYIVPPERVVLVEVEKDGEQARELPAEPETSDDEAPAEVDAVDVDTTAEADEPVDAEVINSAGWPTA
jgi:hypothetical protein